MGAVTAKAKVYKNDPQGEPVYAHSVALSADYADGANKAWAYATPSLNLSLTVIPEVAVHFPVGQAFTLTFTPDEPVIPGTGG